MYAALTLLLCFKLAMAAARSTPVFYDLAMGPKGSQITEFSATFQVPRLPASSGFHAIWPGLLTVDGLFILQNVVDDNQGTSSKGIWQFAPWYGPDGSPGIGYHQYRDHIITVNPGDSVVSTFSLSSTTAQSATWVSAWSIGGSVVSSGAVSSALTQTNSQNPFSSAGLFVELQSGGQWNFGPIEWTDVVITIDTNDSSWCSKEHWINKGYGSSPVAAVASEGVVTRDSRGTTCTFDSIIFQSA